MTAPNEGPPQHEGACVPNNLSRSLLVLLLAAL